MSSSGAYSVVHSELPTSPAPVRSIVKLLGGMLSLAAPDAAMRANRLHELVAACVKAESLADGWIFEAAAQLAPLAGVALAEEPFALLADIPRCDKVAAILRGDAQADLTVATGIALLKVAMAVDDRRMTGLGWDVVLAELRTNPEALPPRFVDALQRVYASRAVSEPTQDLPLGKLRVGMVCAEEVLASSGSVIVPKNAVLHAVTLERLRRFADGAGVREPVRVFATG